MELNQEIKYQIAALLAKPSKVTNAHAEMLAGLANTYPYYQPIHILLAKASAGAESYNQLLTKAALYSNGNAVHQVIYETKSLATADLLKVVTYAAIGFKTKLVEVAEESETSSLGQVDRVEDTIALNEQDAIEEEIGEFEIIVEEKPQILVTEENERTSESDAELTTTIEENDADEDAVFEEINEFQPLTIEKAKNSELIEPKQIKEEEVAESKDRAEIEAEVKIEIEDKVGELSFNIETIEQYFEEEEATQIEVEVKGKIEVENAPLAKFENEAVKEEFNENDLAFEGIVSTDFFAFEKNFTGHTTQIAKEKNTVIQPEEYDQKAEEESIVVSKYDDDKLPYTFLWWLNKTRKEHAQIFQPYATAKKTAVTGELQQQYVEHIFHIQTPFTHTGSSKEIGTNALDNKGNEIITNFIKNDPIIRALKPDQIDNENKAKKSAEDHYDLVSETLAAIYIEQTLYHKAIDTYQKLSLKFPEKSRYFADLIQSLEKKI